MLKTFVYALAFLFIPFLFIKGGFNNVPIMWNNCFDFKGKKAEEVRRNNISIASLFNQIAFDFNSLTGVSIYGFTNILTKIFKFTLLIGTIVVFAFAKKSELKMQISLLTILAYIIFQDGSYGYVMIYILIPILFYLIDFDKISKFDKYFYGICFIIIALPIFYTFNFLTYHAVILFALAIKCFVDIIKDIIKIHKETKAKVENTQSGEQTEVKIDAEKVENSPSQETTTENASNLKNDEDLNSEKIAQTKTAKASNLKKKSTKTL